MNDFAALRMRRIRRRARDVLAQFGQMKSSFCREAADDAREWLPRCGRLIAALLLSLLPALALGQSYPSRPIHFVVPYPPGGAADVVTRVVADSLKSWATVVVESKAGANGNIGADYVLRQPADGYTFLVAAGFLTVGPQFQPALQWSHNSFVPVGMMVVGPPNVFVVPAKSPYNTLQDFVRSAKESPRKINVGTPSLGSSNHLGLELFYSVAGIETFPIPYQGAATVVGPILRNEIEMSLLSQSIVLPHIQSGKMKPLAISSPQRSKTLPEVPTVAEAGFAGADLLPWFALVAPPGTPRDVVENANAALRKALSRPDVVQRLEAIGAEVVAGSPGDLQRYIDREADLLGRLIKQRNIRTQ